MDFKRDIFLMMDDRELSEKCTVTFSKGSGPGGQKRNKTSSLAKVCLPELGISAEDCTERSQHRNRSNALKKLRMQIAFKYRIPRETAPDQLECSLNSPAYSLFAAQLLDILTGCSFDHHAAAKICGISPSALLKKLHRDPALWQMFQKQRKELDLPVLLPPR